MRKAAITGTIQPNCNHCQHYYITHDANMRYGCHALGFKSQQLPCQIVIRASGQACQFFLRKNDPLLRPIK